MILTKTIIISVNGNQAAHYEKLGYKIPRYKNKDYGIYVKRGTKLEVRVEDLPKKSSVKILCKCDNCGKERMLNYFNYKEICAKCSWKKLRESQKGNKHPNWKNGYSLVRKNCEVCSKEIEYNLRRCSECYKKLIIENIEKRIKFCSDCGIKIHHTAKRRCSTCANSGKNNPAYNPNLSESDRKIKQKYALGLAKWKYYILKRDNYTCQCCNFIGKKNDGKLNAHHIKNFKDNEESRLDINNGITLCVECHKKFHKKYGKKNTNEIQLKKFMDDFDDKNI